MFLNSQWVFKKEYFMHDEFCQRLEDFVDEIAKTNVDVEKIPGLSSQARYNYRNRKSLPAGKSLMVWAVEYRLNLNWLFLGYGEMFVFASADGGYAETLEYMRLHMAELEAENAQLKDELLDVHRELRSMTHGQAVVGIEKGDKLDYPNVREFLTPYPKVQETAKEYPEGENAEK